MEQRHTLIAWLRDAHAMERATLDNIQRLLKRMDGYPEFTERYRMHMAESESQLDRVNRALDKLAAAPSAVKDTTTRATGWFEAYVAALSDDEEVKHCLAAFAYENFEMASYTSLIAAADACGENSIAADCRLSLSEEKAMAKWLEDFIPKVTVGFLNTKTARRGVA
jgi:ferritin-like metal-binding protein YciE